MSQSAQLLEFIDQSSTAFHAVETMTSKLKKKGYQELKENADWKLSAGSKYYISRADASLIIFQTPKKWSASSAFKIVGAHTDSPCLKVKSNPISQREGYQLLNIEIYGGVLLNSWFDRDLLLGGRVLIEGKDGKLTSKVITLSSKLRIPRLAIHLDRNVNKEGFKVNPQEQMFPIIGLDENMDFEQWIKKETKIDGKLLGWDLFLFDAEKSSFGGVNNEFIYAPRLDNLGSVHASFEALIDQKPSETDVQMAAYFQHEEIGSNSQNGAKSNFIEATLKRIVLSFTDNEQQFYQTMAQSFFISADMAHAVHPSYSGAHDPNHKPKLNQGPVIKSNANMRYASDGFSIATFKQICAKANVPHQDFNNRNDMGCGSTIGPMTAAKLGIPTIDIGNPMLSMHSIREMAGTKDHEMLVKVLTEFYK